MAHATRIVRRLQRPEDLIDFPVSDTFRDHFARQNMTYDSGRAAPQPRPRRPMIISDWADDCPIPLAREIDALKAELAKERQRAARSQAEVEALRLALRRKAPARYAGVLEAERGT